MIRLLAVIGLTCSLVVPVCAQFSMDQATFHEADCYSPVLASSPDGLTMLAYGASGDPLLMDFAFVQTIPTTGTGSESWPAPQGLGAGNAAAICYSRTGFHVAVVSGEMLLIYDSDLTGNWDLENVTMIPTNGSVLGIDMLGITSDAAGPDVFLTMHTYHYGTEDSGRIQYASHSGFGWSDLEIVVQAGQYSSPQMTWAIGPAGPWAMIYFLEENEYDVYLHKTIKEPGVGWSPPELVPQSPIKQEFDVVTSGFLQRNFLGLEAAPTCPCGTISHQEYVSGTWSEPENMTADYSDYDSPGSPCIAVDTEGRIHAFWMQLATAPDFTPWYKSLEYRVLEDGVWTDAGGFLNEDGHGGPFGSRVALTVYPSPNPVLAWTRRDTIESVPMPQQIWVARQPGSSPVPESEIGRARLTLSAWPNPFNPQVNLAFEVEKTQVALLDIFDARGCRVAKLIDGVVDSGRTVVSWSGKDQLGHSLPSGVYFARLKSGSQKDIFKLVLAE